MESHQLLELEVTICNIPTTCHIDSGSIHINFNKRMFDKLGLRATMGEILEIVQADGSKILVDKLCHISLQFCREMQQAILYYVIDTLSNFLILGMQFLTGSNPTIRWLDYMVDLEYGQSIVILREQAQKKRFPMVQLCSAKVGIKEIYRGEQAQFMILCAPDASHLHGVGSIQGNGIVVHDQSSNPALASKW